MSGKRVAAVARGKKGITIWDRTTGKVVAVRHETESVNFLEPSPGREAFLLCIDDRLVEIDANNGNLIRQHKFEKTIDLMALSPDGNLLFMAWRSKKASILDARTWKERHPFRVPPESICVNHCVWSPCSKKFVWKGLYNSTLALHDITGGKVATIKGHQAPIIAVRVDMKRKRIITTGEDDTMRIWNAIDGRLLRTIETDPLPFGQIKTCDSRGWVAAKDKHVAIIHILDFDGKYVDTVDNGHGRLSSIALLDNPPRIATVNTERHKHGMSVDVMQVSPGKLQRKVNLPKSEKTARLTPTGDKCVSYRREDLGPKQWFTCWRTRDGKQLWSISFNGELHYPERYGISDNGDLFFVETNGDLYLVDMTNGHVRYRLRVGHMMSAVGLSPCRQTVAVANGDKTIQIYELASGQRVMAWDSDKLSVSAIHYSATGEHLCTGAGTSALLWDVAEVLSNQTGVRTLDVNTCVAKLGDADAAVAYQAGLALTRRPGVALPLIGTHFAHMVLVESEVVDKLVMNLNSDKVDERVRAETALEQLGDVVGGRLRRLIDDPTTPAESKRRAKRLNERLQWPYRSESLLQSIRAIAVLERIGCKQAMAMLETISRTTQSAIVAQHAREAKLRCVERQSK